MNVNKEDLVMRKWGLLFAFFILGIEIILYEEIIENILSIDYSTLYKSLGFIMIIKALIIYGLIDIFSVFLMDKIMNSKRMSKIITEARIEKIKDFRDNFLKNISDRWNRYNIFEKTIIVFAFIQLLIATISILFYMPMTRKHATKTVGKKLGRKLIFVLFAFIPVKILTVWLEWFIALPLINKLKRNFKAWKIKKRRKTKSVSMWKYYWLFSFLFKFYSLLTLFISIYNRFVKINTKKDTKWK